MELKEPFRLSKKELTGNLKVLVDGLRAIDPRSDDRLIQQIIRSVEFGYPEAAKTLCWNEADKFRSKPEVIELLRNNLFDEDEKKPWSSMKK